MIAKRNPFISAARAATICFLLAGVTAGSQLMLAPPAHAQNAPTTPPPTMPGVPTLPGAPTNTGPQMPTVNVKPGKGVDTNFVIDDDKNRPTTSPVFEFLKNVKEQAGGLFKDGGSFMPILLTPLRVAAMLLFLVYYVGFYFMRQERVRQEAEAEAQANEPKVPLLPEEEV